MYQRPLKLALAVITAAIVVVSAAPAALAAPSGTTAAGTAAENVSLTCFPHAPTDDLRFDNTWGAGRSGGRHHQGTDVMSPKGLDVLAVADGVVAGLKSGGPKSGYYIRLAHGGWESWYLHLNNDSPGTDDGRGGDEAAFAPGLSIGDRVDAGDIIGYVGDSGNAEWAGSHTHFELHIGERPVNPYPYLIDVAERVDGIYQAVTPLITSPLDSPADEAAALRGLVWGELASSPSAQCLSSGYKDALEHVFGELPREGVLLAGVVAR